MILTLVKNWVSALSSILLLFDVSIMTLECQRLKAQVVQEIRANQQLEQDLNMMDIKIGLLVKNRITLQVGVITTLLYKGNEVTVIGRG